MNGAFRGSWFVVRAVAAAWLALGLSASAQTFTVDRSVLSGGGGTSTGGPFSLTGTIGQIDAGVRLAGGSYALDGGFHSVAVAVQTPGAPLLSVVRSGGNLIISWAAADSAGFVVEQSGALAVPASWAASGATVSDNGTTKSMTIPIAPGYRFFRLRKP